MCNSETQRIVQNAIALKFEHIIVILFILFLVTCLNTKLNMILGLFFVAVIQSTVI